jgi:hypothetical protein
MEIAKRLRDISKEKAIKSYTDLKESDCMKVGKFSRIGLDCLDYFFLHHRIKAKTRRHISFHQALKDKTLMKYINGKIRTVRGNNTSSINSTQLLRKRYSLFQLYYGSINQFRPTEARRVYCKLQPKIGVLDFSAGWGGRCLGAMSYGVPYIGIDANTKMRSSYTNMIRAVEPTADVTLVFQPSETVDFSRYNYDLIFTSPPYFMIEEYEKMPQYGSKEGFLEKFFRPVVASAWKNLKSPGYMALNMPKEMYDSVKDFLPPLHKRLQLAVSSRHPRNASRGEPIGKVDTGGRTEGIYIWKKGGTQTRKMKKR